MEILEERVKSRKKFLQKNKKSYYNSAIRTSYMKKRTTISILTLRDIAITLDCSADYLLGFRDDPGEIVVDFGYNFGDIIESLLPESRTRRKELMKIMGVSATTMHNYFERNYFPKVSTVIKLSKHFNLSIDYLIGLSKI